jgi:nucleoside-diphosphate-sugar epimerase
MADTVLVTGATGFLGGAVMRRLRAEGVPVIGLGRDPGRLAALRADGFDLREQDLARPLSSSVIAVIGPVAAIIHCAARSAPHGTLQAFQSANVTATQHVLDLAHALGVRRFVHISSSSVSFAARDQLGVRESDPLPPPFNAYARTKAAAERLVLAAPDLGPVVLRPRGIYGLGDTALLPRLLRAAGRGPLPLLRGGAARIDLTHIDDVVDAVLAALQGGRAIEGRIFNISGGEVLPISTIVAGACARAGVTPRWRALPLAPLIAAATVAEGVCRILPGSPEPVITRYGLALFAYAQSLDLTGARTVLGWVPRVSFEDGLARTFALGAPG